MRITTDVDEAVAALRAGRLVAFPTETVYGLGADAERPEAVRRIFAVKGRPTTHPLIVHLAGPEQLGAWGRHLGETAFRLAEAFWPGPLTLVVERAPRVPLEVTGGLDTVGLRVPSHEMARALLSRFGGGVAAPSANRFGAVSPTSAAHVASDLGDERGLGRSEDASVELVLDGGPCTVGVESTIVDLSGDLPALLRPGGVSREALEDVLGAPLSMRAKASVRAPGMLPSHYAPRAIVKLVAPGDDVASVAARERSAGRRVGMLVFAEEEAPSEDVTLVRLEGTEFEQARRLYEALRELDRRGCEVIVASLPDERGLGLAMIDRLRRAAGPRD